MIENTIIQATSSWPFVEARKLVKERQKIFEEKGKISLQTGLEINDHKLYGQHYSNTLKQWRKSFLNSWDQISRQGFNLSFKNMWDFYLSYCEAGFKSNNIDLIQFSLCKK